MYSILHGIFRETQILTVSDCWYRLPDENKARMSAAVATVASEAKSMERLRRMTSENPWLMEDIVAVLTEKGDQIANS